MTTKELDTLVQEQSAKIKQAIIGALREGFESGDGFVSDRSPHFESMHESGLVEDAPSPASSKSVALGLLGGSSRYRLTESAREIYDGLVAEGVYSK